jgi:predicted transcriptional regulator
MEAGAITLEFDLDTKSFEEQIKQTEIKLERLMNSYQKALNPPKGMKVSEEKLQSLRTQIEETTNKLKDLREKQVQLDNIPKSNELDGFLSNIMSKTKSLITQTAKWGLALFGIRSIYGMLSSSASTLSQYNKQIGVDMQYIRYALATTLQPIIEYLIKLAYKLLSLINSLAMAWFGVNIFARASVDSFNKVGDSIGGASQSAKDLKKQLAGFDEMNVLQDNTSGSGGGGGIGGTDISPQIDLSKVDSGMGKVAEKVKKYVKDISSFWENDWMNAFGDIEGNWELMWDGMVLFTEGFYTTFKGIFKLVGGVVDFFVALFKGDMEGVDKAFSEMGEGIVNIALGIAEIIGGILLTIGGLVVGLILDIKDWVAQLWVNISIGVYKFIDRVFEAKDKVVGVVNSLVSKIQNFSDSVSATFTILKNKIQNKITELQNWLTNHFGSFGTKVGNALGDGLKYALNIALAWIEKQLNKPIDTINSLIGTINRLTGGGVTRLTRINLPRLAKGGIISMPGRGVPVGSAIAGENKREAVLPLQDSQVLSEIGQAIGKYVTINATIENSMNGRVISRELQRINAENDFAFNR